MLIGLLLKICYSGYFAEDTLTTDAGECAICFDDMNAGTFTLPKVPKVALIYFNPLIFTLSILTFAM